jgi:hypothetical protein
LGQASGSPFETVRSMHRGQARVMFFINLDRLPAPTTQKSKTQN